MSAAPQWARDKAAKSKRSLAHVLGTDRQVCSCTRCQGLKKQRPRTITEHLALYGSSNDENVEMASPGPAVLSPGGLPLEPEPGPSSWPIGNSSLPNPTPLSPVPDNYIAARHSSHPASLGSSPGMQVDNPSKLSAPPSPKSRFPSPKSAEYRPFLLSSHRPGIELLPTPEPLTPARIDLRRTHWPVNDLAMDNFFPHSPFLPAPPPSPNPDRQKRQQNDVPSPAPTISSEFSERSVKPIDPEDDALFYEDLLGDDTAASQPPAYMPEKPCGFYCSGRPDDTDGDDDDGDDDDGDDDDGGDDDSGGDDGDDEGGGGGDDGGDHDGDGEPNPDPPNGPAPQDMPQALPGAPVDPPNGAGDPDNPNDDELCAAFMEHPLLRNIYIRVYARAAFAGATVKDIHAALESHRLVLESLVDSGHAPEEILDDLATMPRTLRTLQRRLGVDTDGLLRTYALCTTCGKRYSMAYINGAQQPNCPRHVNGAICGNRLFRVSRLYDGTCKRIPVKSFSYLPVHKALERILIRVGMPDKMQHWRTENDAPAEVPPLTKRDWRHNTPEDQLFGDISTAYGWRSQRCGMMRSYNVDDQQYADEEPEDGPQSLARKPLGISLAMNFDGFEAFKNKKHEVQGVFLVINNLPFYLRTLIENMMLVITMPGPKQPSSYELDQMLEPLIDDLIELEKGIEMKVYDSQAGRPVVHEVYAHLSMAIVDYIARIKLAGHAGTASHRHFCLYCLTPRCYLSVADGFQDLDLRNAMNYLQRKHEWLRAAPEDREEIRQEHGAIFTEMDRLPGWYAPLCSPIDAMHLFDLGLTKRICQDIILKLGLLHPRRRNQAQDERPLQRFIAFMKRCYFPSHCSRLPPQFDEMHGRVKAEQWRCQSVVLHLALFEALREGDMIPNGDLPRGGRRTKVYAYQAATAQKVHRNRCAVHNDQGGDDDHRPQEADCWPSRNPRDFFKTILCYLVAHRMLFVHQLSRRDLAFAQQLLWRTGVNFARMNINLTPSFHYMMHIEEQVLRFGSVYGTWTNAFERANRVLINVNHNGRGLGMLETTMGRGFLKRSDCFRLVEYMQALENPSRDDLATTDIVLKLLREGPEHELQQRMHGHVLVDEAPFRFQERAQLPSNPSQVNFRLPDHQQYFELVLNFISLQVPEANVYAEGARPHNGVRVAPQGSTLAFPYVSRLGVRYGVDGHYRGHSARYGYIHGRNAALIKKVYRSTIRMPDEIEREIVCVIVQRFKRPDRQPVFPWHHWSDRLGTHAWAFEQLEEPEAISPDELTGVFALSDIELSYGHYWITCSMDHTKPEELQQPGAE